MESTPTTTIAQLVLDWNSLVAHAQTLGLTKYKPINSKFKTIADGSRRLDALKSAIRAREASEAAVETAVNMTAAAMRDAPPPAQVTEENDDMASRRKTKKTKTKAARSTAATARTRSPRQSLANGTSIKAKTQEYNSLVPRAVKAGHAGFRHHTSDFGSHEAANKQLKRIRDAISG